MYINVSISTVYVVYQASLAHQKSCHHLPLTAQSGQNMFIVYLHICVKQETMYSYDCTIHCWISLVPRPRPAFCRLQYVFIHAWGEPGNKALPMRYCWIESDNIHVLSQYYFKVILHVFIIASIHLWCFVC